MANNLIVRMDLDGSGFERNAAKYTKTAKDMGKDIESYINDKFKSLVAPIVIEQSIQKTAEWASELKKRSEEHTSELQSH